MRVENSKVSVDARIQSSKSEKSKDAKEQEGANVKKSKDGAAKVDKGVNRPKSSGHVGTKINVGV